MVKKKKSSGLESNIMLPIKNKKGIQSYKCGGEAPDGLRRPDKFSRCGYSVDNGGLRLMGWDFYLVIYV